MLYLGSYCQSIDLTKWKKDVLPISDVYDSISNCWYNPANVSKDNWIFKVIENRVEIVKNDFKQGKGDVLPFGQDFISTNLPMIKGNRFVKKVSDGYIVGINRGEFGGGLFFISQNGLENYQIAGYLRIKEIFEFNSRIYAIEGVAHLGSNYGKVIEIYKDTMWKCKIVSDLIEAPILTAKYKKEQIIVTSQYILKMTKNGQIEQILQSPFFWGALYPSSFFIEKNDIYLAMRQGILKIKYFTKNPIYEWYLPK